MRFISDYMRDDALRHELNALTRSTFYFDFEDWVTGGYFEGEYIPYSFEEDGRVISNASANIMNFCQRGSLRRYVQIGTVMTDEAFRNRGLARRLIERIIADYEGRCDGIYLFGNLSALDFYRKLGFGELTEHRYELRGDAAIALRPDDIFRPLDAQDASARMRYRDAVRRAAPNAALDQINRYGLHMFYTADCGSVYYCAGLDCYAVLEREERALTLAGIVCPYPVSLREVVARIPDGYDTLALGFAPLADDEGLFRALPYDGGEDYRLFYRGDALRSIEDERLYFPHLSHA